MKLIILLILNSANLAAQEYLKNFQYQSCDSSSVYDIRFLRNEIYARHGIIFQDSSLIVHFNKKEWYRPQLDSFINNITLSKDEQKMLDRLISLERSENAHFKLIESFYRLIGHSKHTEEYYEWDPPYRINVRSFGLENCPLGTPIATLRTIFGQVRASKRYQGEVPWELRHYSFDGILVYTVDGRLHSLFCYSARIRAYDGWGVGSRIIELKKVMPGLNLKNDKNGVLYASIPPLSMTIVYEDGIILLFYITNTAG